MWFTVTDDGRVVGLAMHTPPHRLFVSRMPETAAATLAAALAPPPLGRCASSIPMFGHGFGPPSPCWPRTPDLPRHAACEAVTAIG